MARDFGSITELDYKIEMLLSAIRTDPDNVDLHNELRLTSLHRTAAGGRQLGMMFRVKFLRASEPLDKLLASAKLLAYDPGNTDHMLSLMQHAHRAGCKQTSLWIKRILRKAEADSREDE